VNDKQILITGATNGIGLAAAEALAALGASLAIVGRSKTRTRIAEARIRAAARGEQASVRRLAAEVLARPLGMDFSCVAGWAASAAAAAAAAAAGYARREPDARLHQSRMIGEMTCQANNPPDICRAIRAMVCRARPLRRTGLPAGAEKH
jgi:NAD(P)-dependent dehydrogenase (short-subunit alcohol dehydrogenase family)